MMAGKILKISSNDLYGNVDDRKVAVFACFEHSKYMNNYVIFCFDGEYGKKKLYYGSVHLKKDSLVIFAVKNDIKQYIDSFLLEFLSNNLESFKVLDIDKMVKVELVSYNEMEYDNVQELDEKSIIRVVINEVVDNKKKSPVLLYFLVFVLILMGVGITVLYFKPELFSIKYKGLECSDNLYDREMKLYYDIDKNIIFDEDDKLEKIDVVREYTFTNSDNYFDFKNNNQHELYFNNGEGYKYIDEELKLRILYQESNVIDDYTEMLSFMKKEGFSCVEREYEK